jgi:transposase
MLKYGTEYSDAGQDNYERQYQERVVRNLQHRAKALGFELMPTAVEPEVT